MGHHAVKITFSGLILDGFNPKITFLTPIRLRNITFDHFLMISTKNERALTKEDRALLKNRFVPFPPNEQMVFDAGEDIKLHLKAILKDNSFR